MNSNDLLIVYTAEVIDDEGLSLEQLCRAFDVKAEWIISLVEESIIAPQGDIMDSWRFSGSSLRRVRSALRLQRDLGVNLAGIALALDLLDENENLRLQVALSAHH